MKQAALGLACEPRDKRGLTAEMATELNEIASISDALVREMDFRFLYHPRKKVLSVGYEIAAGRLGPSYSDLLASQARTPALLGLAKGGISPQSWVHTCPTPYLVPR